MKRRGWSVVAVGSVVCVLAPLARAGPVTFEFAGEVTRVVDSDDLLQGVVTVGSPFSGSYTFESKTPDSDPNPRRGIYDDSILGLSGHVARLPFDLRPGAATRIELRDEYSGPNLDSYRVLADVEFAGRPLDFFIRLGDTTGMALSTDLLLVAPPDLGLFSSREFHIFDGSEQLHIVVDGMVQSLVPEPTTAVVLLAGLLLLRPSVIVRKPSRGKQNLMHSRTRWFLLVLIFVHGGNLLQTVRGTDCNGNGILDSQELATPCKADVIFLFDTSISMRDEMADICEAIDIVINTLPVLLGTQNFHAEKLTITSAGQDVPCTCCNGNVPTLYGTTAPGVPYVLGDCFNSDDGPQEEWAVATAVVAANRNWTPGALRIVVPVFDEGSRCGDLPHLADPGDDRDAVRDAARVAACQRVIVAPILAPPTAAADETVRSLAHALVEKSEPRGRLYESSTVNLSGKLVQFVLDNCPQNCNFNGVLDSCDIRDGLSLDCSSLKSECCIPSNNPGCGDVEVEQCVCIDNFAPFCCTDSWGVACADIAATACAAICDRVPNNVPDECEPSPDCNGNGIRDTCDLSCALPFGVCDVAGCGQKPDCNGNCVPDDCDAATCVDDPGVCDCNDNDVLDECDISGGTSCDLNEDGVPDECFACCVAGACANVSGGCTGTWYESEGFTCTDCTCVTRACCNGNQCSAMPECDCKALGRTVPQRTPVPVDCASNACNIGACCLPSGGCDDRAAPNPPCNPVLPATCMNQSRCVNTLGGVFLGGLLCTPDPCAAPPPNPRPEAPLPEPQQCPPPTANCQGNVHECACQNALSCVNGTCRCETDADCRGQAKCVNEVCYVPRNRYLSILPKNPGLRTALRLTFVSLPSPFNIFNDDQLWIGAPVEVCEVSGYAGACPNCTDPTLLAATLVCLPHYREWDTTRVLNVYHRVVVPGGEYRVEAVAEACPLSNYLKTLSRLYQSRLQAS